MQPPTNPPLLCSAQLERIFKMSGRLHRRQTRHHGPQKRRPALAMFIVYTERRRRRRRCGRMSKKSECLRASGPRGEKRRWRIEQSPKTMSNNRNMRRGTRTAAKQSGNVNEHPQPRPMMAVLLMALPPRSIIHVNRSVLSQKRFFDQTVGETVRGCFCR